MTKDKTVQEMRDHLDLHLYGAPGLCASVAKLARRDVYELREAGVITSDGQVVDPWPVDEKGNPLRVAHDYTSSVQVRDLLQSFTDGRLEVWLDNAGIDNDGKDRTLQIC